MIQYKDPGIQSQGAASTPARLDNTAISLRSRVENRSLPGVEVEILPAGMRIKKLGCVPVGGPVSKRGKIKGFSGRSKRRMMERQARIDWDGTAEKTKKARSGKGFLYTLTYGDFPDSAKRCKADLAAWKMRMEREFGKAGSVWKLEPQKRGVPHYHVLMIFKEKMPWKWVSQVARDSWVDITGAKVVDCQTIYAKNGDYGRLMRYLAKYLGKIWEGSEEWGRVWGIWHQELLPMGTTFDLELTHRGYVELCRRMRRWGRCSKYLRKSSSDRNGMLIYGSKSQMVQLLRGLDFVYGGQHEENHEKRRGTNYAM